MAHRIGRPEPAVREWSTVSLRALVDALDVTQPAASKHRQAGSRCSSGSWNDGWRPSGRIPGGRAGSLNVPGRPRSDVRAVVPTKEVQVPLVLVEHVVDELGACVTHHVVALAAVAQVHLEP